MKKVNISIAYEEEKYAALTMYLTQKNMSLETELTAALDSLYAKQVPPAVLTTIKVSRNIRSLRLCRSCSSFFASVP